MGKIIVIEGIEGSGKETQSKLLVDSLNKLGLKAIEFSFPMYDTPTGRIFKDCLLSNNSYFPCKLDTLDPELVCLYTAADRKYNIKTIVLSGGVAANSELRKKLFALQDIGYKTFAPQMKFCTDNAAMVASCAYFNPIKTDDPLILEAFSRS